jgi:hypothetical protein
MWNRRAGLVGLVFRAILVICVAGLPAGLVAQTAPTSARQAEALRRLIAAITAFIVGRDSGSEEERRAVSQLNDTALRLQAGLATLPVSGLYIVSIEQTAAALERAARGEGGPAQVVQLAAADLALKLAGLEARTDVRDAWDGSVPVEVTTVRQGRTANGYLVRFNMAGLADDPDPFTVFNDRTSPSRGRLPPGNYVARIEMNEGEPMVRQRVAIGWRPGATVRLRIEIP